MCLLYSCTSRKRILSLVVNLVLAPKWERQVHPDSEAQLGQDVLFPGKLNGCICALDEMGR